MKINTPALPEEFLIESSVAIVSKTDLRGIITYANDAFVEVSGFSREELIGRSHNMVRHPDMPPQAFADMWRTLKQGQPWKGVVKNRRKDGRYYWVEATVVPIRKDDETVGYMSVRQKVGAEQVAAAEALYARLRQSKEEIHPHSLKNLLTIRAGFFMGSIFVVMLMIAGGILGIGGLRLSNTAMETMYENLLNPVAGVGRMNYLLADTRSVLQALDIENPGDTLATGERKLSNLQHVAVLTSNRKEIERQIADMESMPLGLSDRRALTDLRIKHTELAEKVLIPLEGGLRVGISREQFTSLLLQAAPLYREATEAGIALQHSLLSSASHTYQSMLERNELIWKIALAGILFGITMVIVVGRIFLQNIVRPLDEAIHAFDRIAQGDLSHDVDIYGKGETGQLIRASATMQLHLKVMMDELTLVANRIHAYCRNLNASLFDVSEHSEEQHNRVYQAKEAVDMAAHEAASVSLSVERLLGALARVTECADNPQAREQALATLEGEIADLATTLRLQAFAADEVAMKMHQIAALIVENRQQVQEAYAASAHVKEVTDELRTLVSHFETHREIAETAC